MAGIGMFILSTVTLVMGFAMFCGLYGPLLNVFTGGGRARLRDKLTAASILLAPIAAVLLLIPRLNVPNPVHLRWDDQNKLRQIALASLNYESARGEFPSHEGNSRGKGMGLSWRVHILPFLEQKELYDRFNMDEPWDSPHNKALIKEMPMDYASAWPATKIPLGHTLFQRPIGNGAIDSGDGQKILLEEITDGMSKTIMIVQVDPVAAVIWTKPADYYFNPNNPLQGLGNIRGKGLWMFALCDGSIELFETELGTQEQAGAMFTRAAGDAFTK